MFEWQKAQIPIAHQKEGIDQPKKVQHHIEGGQQQKEYAKSSKP